MNALLILLIGTGVVVCGVLLLRLHAFLSLIAGALVVALLSPMKNETAGARVAMGFGETAKNVGILIAMAAIIGQTLLESGAAERVIVSMRRVLGDKRTPLAFVLGGFLLTIPCFFETVFYLMIPLGKIMRDRKKGHS